MRIGLLALALGLAASGPAAAQKVPGVPDVIPNVSQARPANCAPEKMVTAVIRNISPGLAAADRNAQPRQIWRLGSIYLRSEEQPDPARGDQSLVIVAEPDLWAIDLSRREGTHQLDPGPDFEVHAPILPVPGTDPEFVQLEFGCEAEFVQKLAPIAQRTVQFGMIEAALHAVVHGDQMVAILMDRRRNAPLLISYLRQNRPVFVLRYDQYARNLEPRPGFFAPPEYVKITERGRPRPPPPAPPPTSN